MMNIAIRRAVRKDLGEMQALFVETIRHTCKNDYSPEQIKVWTSSIKNVERWNLFFDTQYIVVAEMDNKIVGYGSLEDGDYLDFLYVHKDYVRCGIASYIFQELKQESLRLGHDKLRSDVSITARPFFEKQGFRVVKENKNVISGIEIINFHMVQN